MTERLLVIGAKPGSLGEAIADHATEWEVFRAGVSGEPYYVNANQPSSFREFINTYGIPDSIVCTAGTNLESSILGDVEHAMATQFVHNAMGPLSILSEWLKGLGKPLPEMYGNHFVAISSNSANIARSASLGYCASKAALSMALRCAAREVAKTGLSIYAYEPGWIDGTPMSVDVQDRLDQKDFGAKPHRIPSGNGISADVLGRMIINNLKDHSGSLNGCLIRVDGGEQ